MDRSSVRKCFPQATWRSAPDRLSDESQHPNKRGVKPASRQAQHPARIAPEDVLHLGVGETEVLRGQFHAAQRLETYQRGLDVGILELRPVERVLIKPDE